MRAAVVVLQFIDAVAVTVVLIVASSDLVPAASAVAADVALPLCLVGMSGRLGCW